MTPFQSQLMQPRQKTVHFSTMEILTWQGNLNMRLGSIEHLLIEALYGGQRPEPQMKIDAAVQTDDIATELSCEPPSTVVATHPQVEILHINHQFPVVMNEDVCQYRQRIVRKLSSLRDMRGRQLVTIGRVDSHCLLLRVLVFLNRPREFVNERWPQPRCVFTCVDELQDYMLRMRDVINDFYAFSRCGRMPVSGIPVCRTLDELKRPFQRRNPLRFWTSCISFS
jgi:hypothetical protein